MAWTTPAPADPFMVLRLWPHHHREPQLVEETLAALQRHRAVCDEVWFCTEIGTPLLAVHRDSAAAMAPVARRIRALGIRPGLQIGWTIGHGDGSGFPGNRCDGLAWRHKVGPAGEVGAELSCPRDPAFLAYVAEMAGAYAAAIRPSSIWLDDDARINQGCYCDACVAGFARDHAAPAGRAELAAALAAPGGGRLRLAWVAYGQRAVAALATAIAQAVASASPDTRLGLQHCGPGGANGEDWSPVLAALAAPGRPAGSRPGGGNYQDRDPIGLLHKAYSTASQVARLPDAIVDRACPEVESFPHTALGKTPHGVAVESALALAAGANFLSYAVTSSAVEAWEDYAPLLGRLAAWRPFLHALATRSAGTVLCGADTTAPSGYVGRQLEPGTAPGAAFAAPPGYDFYQKMCELGLRGLPLCCDGLAAVHLLTAPAIAVADDRDVERWLERGVVCDGPAAAALAARLGAARCGFAVEQVARSSVAEVVADDPALAGHAGRAWYRMLCADRHAARVVGRGAAIRVLGRYRSGGPHGEDAGISSACITTPEGRRVAVFGYAGFDGNVSNAIRAQFLLGCDWAADGSLPVMLDTPARVAAFARVRPGDRRQTATVLVNAAIDRTPPLRLRVRRPAGTAAVWHHPEVGAQDLPVVINGDEATVTIPGLGPWEVGWIGWMAKAGP